MFFNCNFNPLYTVRSAISATAELVLILSYLIACYLGYIFVVGSGEMCKVVQKRPLTIKTGVLFMSVIEMC